MQKNNFVLFMYDSYRIELIFNVKKIYCQFVFFNS